MIVLLSESMGENTAYLRGLAMLAMLLVLATAVILMLVTVRWGRHLVRRKRRRGIGRTAYVDAWREAGNRAELAEPGEDTEADRDNLGEDGDGPDR